MIFRKIPYRPLTGEQKQKALQILSKGNILLKKWAALYPAKKYRQFRNAVMAGDSNPDNQIPYNQLEEFQNDLPDMKAIRQTIFPELENRSVEQAILEGFSAMAEKHARKWAQFECVGLTLEDFLQEAYIQVIETMYSWLPEYNTDISTFIYIALKNRMSNVVNQQGHLLCPLTNTDLALVIRYTQTKDEMSNKVTFDEVVEKLGLSSEDGRHLNILLTRVYTENQLVSDDQKLTESISRAERNDYTGLRQNVKTNNPASSMNVNEILDRAGLTPFERELIEKAMDPVHGWQTAFAESHLNPTTNKPYSRMRITQVLEIVRAKVRRVMESSAECEAA